MGISGDLFIFIVIFKSRLDQVQLIRCVFKEMDGINVKSVASQLFKWSMSYSTEVKGNFTIPNTLKVLCCTQPCTQLCPTQLRAFISQRISIKHRWYKSNVYHSHMGCSSRQFKMCFLIFVIDYNTKPGISCMSGVVSSFLYFFKGISEKRCWSLTWTSLTKFSFNSILQSQSHCPKLLLHMKQQLIYVH